jgi:hypothetical protein
MSKITCVRFGGYVQLVPRRLEAEWRPGHNGIAEITREPDGCLVFRLDSGGDVLVYPQPGTIVTREATNEQPARIAASNTPAQGRGRPPGR